MRISVAATSRSGEGLPEGDAGAVIAVAPADAVTLHWADIPARSAAQAAAAARILVSDASASPIERLHVAVGAAEAGGGETDPRERPIGVVAAERMRAWLDALAGIGIDPSAVVRSTVMFLASAYSVRPPDMAMACMTVMGPVNR